MQVLSQPMVNTRVCALKQKEVVLLVEDLWECHEEVETSQPVTPFLRALEKAIHTVRNLGCAFTFLKERCINAEITMGLDCLDPTSLN